MADAAVALTVIVHTRDSEASLGAALDSVSWVDEIIVVDMQSQDSTVRIARESGAKILVQDVANRVDGIRNQYLDKGRNEWILVLDSDERLAADAPASVAAIIRNQGMEYDAFRIPRFNTIGGQVMRGRGWHPDPQLRLFRKGTVAWSDSHHQIPQVLTGDARLKILDIQDGLCIHHENYRDLGHFIEKQVRYALTDKYPDDPGDYAFGDYMAEAYKLLYFHNDPGNDGDQARALSLIMAWNSIIRGLIHWDRLNPRPELDLVPVMPVREVGEDDG